MPQGDSIFQVYKINGKIENFILKNVKYVKQNIFHY